MLLFYQKAQISFLISSAEYSPPNTKLFNVWKSQFPSIWLGMIWNTSVTEVKFLMFSFGSLDSSDDSSENLSVNQLSYHHYSYFWFNRVDLLLILAIWSFSLGLVFRIFFIWCSDLLKIFLFLILPFLLKVSIFLSSSISICDFFTKMIVGILFL